MADNPVTSAVPEQPDDPGLPGAAPTTSSDRCRPTGLRSHRPSFLDRSPFNRLPFIGRQRWHLLTRRDKAVLALMVGIPLVLDVAIIWGSVIVDFMWSFTDWHGFGEMTGGGNMHRFVGLDNYVQLLSGTYPFFWTAVVHNLFWLAFLMFVATPLGILMAVILDGKLKGLTIYRTVFYIPVVLSLALIGIIWQLQYAPDTNRGWIDGALSWLGYQHPVVLGIDLPFIKDIPFVGQWCRDVSTTDWVGGPLAIIPTVIAASWRHVGYVTILYLAGLQAFDPTLREAASIDGASARQTFFRVVFPVMKPINIVIVVITTIEALRAFDLAYITNGGRSPLELLSTLVTNNATSESSRIGFGSAIAVILAVVSLVPIVIFLVMNMREEKQK
jgi:multiple sugar transport system permease protein